MKEVMDVPLLKNIIMRNIYAMGSIPIPKFEERFVRARYIRPHGRGVDPYYKRRREQQIANFQRAIDELIKSGKVRRRGNQLFLVK